MNFSKYSEESRKKNVYTIIKIIVINIAMVLIILPVAELLVYTSYALTTFKENKYFPGYNIIPVKSNEFFYETVKDFFTDFENESPNNGLTCCENKGRMPVGTEYKSKPGIIIFGCSFAFGHYLKYYQTFGAKLSKLVKRPVYNRSIPGGGFQEMYIQASSDWFYEQVPNVDTVIYVMINDHYRRMKVRNFNVISVLEKPAFKIKNKKLYLLNRDNKIINYIRNSYIARHLNHISANEYLNNKKKAEKLTDETLLYFTESKKELQRHYGNNLKFYVFFYGEIAYSDILRKKLEDNGFITFLTDEATDANLNYAEYLMTENGHPTEKTWDLLTPLFVEKTGLK